MVIIRIGYCTNCGIKLDTVRGQYRYNIQKNLSERGFYNTNMDFCSLSCMKEFFEKSSIEQIKKYV